MSDSDPDITELKVDVGVIKSQMVDMKLVTDRIEKKIDGMKYATVEDLDKFKALVESRYVTKESFEPVKRVVFGLVGIILLGVGAAMIGLVLR